MNKILLVFILMLFSGIVLQAQENYFLSPQNKAYIYHTVRKSPILEQNIGRYIVFKGEEIKFSNGEINYDSTEQVIINNPELLKIYTDEIKRSPKGLISELANKMAIWELNNTLLSFRSNSLEKDGLQTDYQRFENLVLKNLPEIVLKVKKGETEIHPRVEKISNPTLTFKDKVAMLDGFSNWTEEEKQLTINSYNNAIIKWVEQRTKEIFELLGGEADYFENILTAAGDGSSTSGLFEEREKDERGRFNRGLPRAVGLFPYESYIDIKPNSKKKTPEILPKGHTFHEFRTIGNGKETNIHLDVWGYNSDKQTTVVIQKGRYSYPLFGSENTRFLSPDSTYGGGMTYYTLINRVKDDIFDLEEKISGKRGIDFLIKHYEGLRDGKKLSIDKTEKEINDIRTGTITTRTTKKGPKASSQKKYRKKKQERVITLYNELRGLEQKIKDLKEEKKILVFKKQQTEKRHQDMLDLIGEQWVAFKEVDGLYIFEDSTRFDIYTQEFVFPATDDSQEAEVRLIAMPLSHVSSNYDEVMLHINITDAEPEYTSKVRLELNDQFEVDQYKLLQTPLLSSKDSLSVHEFFDALLDKKKNFKLIVRGGGVGKWKYNRVVIDYEPEEFNQYPGTNAEEKHLSKQSDEFKKLRTTEVLINIDREIIFQVNSYTDPVRSNFKPTNKKVLSIMEQNNWSGNQMLSGYRAYITLCQIRDELIVLASEYLTREESSKVIDRLNKEIDKSKITIGRSSLKFKSF